MVWLQLAMTYYGAASARHHLSWCGRCSLPRLTGVLVRQVQLEGNAAEAACGAAGIHQLQVDAPELVELICNKK